MLLRNTTHGDDGGSGIGMMTTCELCRKYSASLRIEPVTDGDYTKCISVVFDGTAGGPCRIEICPLLFPNNIGKRIQRQATVLGGLRLNLLVKPRF